jgi:hypothetical protein
MYWKKLHNEEVHDVLSSSIVTMMVGELNICFKMYKVRKKCVQTFRSEALRERLFLCWEFIIKKSEIY